MIHHPNFNERHAAHTPAYWREELTHMRDLMASINEYGGIDRLRADIGDLESELSHVSGIHRWNCRPEDRAPADLLWTTNNGKQVQPARMNTFHLRGALNKLSHQEAYDQRLFDALEAELSRRGSLAQSTIDLTHLSAHH